MEQYLYHYGILGMKWGIRRYQNPDGSLTAEGKRRARKEYRQDNKTAFEYGKNATLTARAASIASKKEQRAIQKYERFPTQRRFDKAKIAASVREYLGKQEKDWEDSIAKHRDELIAKYGKEAVSNVSRDKYGRINEEVHGIGPYAASMFINIAGAVAMYYGSPFMIVSVPKTKNQMGRKLYRDTKKFEKKRFNQARKVGEIYE